MATTRPLPLSGIRVIDFGHIVAGPFCVRMLADLGADVIKVETASRPGRTGARRGRPTGGATGRTPHMAHINRNRRSIDLDLKTERGLAIARKLVATADVVVENFSSSVMTRLGLGYDALAKIDPRLIYCSMSAYGHSGPRSAWTGMNVNLQACSGLMLATGGEGDPPIGISNSWNDYIGGLHAAVAIIAALSKRKASGVGRHLDVSQFEGSVAMIGGLLFASAVTGKPPARPGTRSSTAAPQGAYRCAGKDEWCAISVQTDAQWQALVSALGDDASSLRDPTYTTLAGRIAGHDAIDEALDSWAGQVAPVDVENRLAAVGVPATAMRRAADFHEVEAWRQIWRPMRESGGTEMTFIGLPIYFEGSAPVAVTEAPRVGASGRDALRDWLDLDEPAITELLGEGVG